MVRGNGLFRTKWSAANAYSRGCFLFGQRIRVGDQSCPSFPPILVPRTRQIDTSVPHGVAAASIRDCRLGQGFSGSQMHIDGEFLMARDPECRYLRQRFWDVQVPKIDSSTRPALLPRRALRPPQLRTPSLGSAPLRFPQMALRRVGCDCTRPSQASGASPPSLLRFGACAYAYRGLPALA